MAETIWNSAVSVYHFMMDNLVVINILLSLVIVFFQRRSPQTVWTWLLLLYFIPILGFVLYLLIGQDFHKSRMFKAKEIEGEIKYAVRRQEETIYRRRLRLTNPAVARYRDLILYNLEAGQAVLTDNNDVRIYTDGKEKFKALLEEMKKAKKYIHFQYYIIRNDELWQHIEPVLIKKAKEGVEVRILFDSMGCRGMHNRDWERLEKEGIHVAEFFPALFGNLQLRMNYRNHRKIVVIDGRVGFVGGFNVGREYLGLDKKKFGYWRDTHLCIEGAAVTSLAVRFVLDWNYAAKENLFQEDTLFEIPKYEREGRDPVQIISSGPDSQIKTIHDNYLRLIHSAKDHVYYNENKTFIYAVPLKDGEDTISVTFGKGKYQLSHVQAYLGSLPERSKTLYQSEVQVDKKLTKDNVIQGTIQVKNDGWFITSIPYDTHFKMYIDGKETKIQKVNTAFLGCEIGSGKHEVRIVYHAPGATEGKVFSMIGIVGFVLLLVL